MKNKKIKEKIWEFFKPNKRKIKAFIIVMVILFILNIFLAIFIGRVGCFPAPCADGSSRSYHRIYNLCGYCTEPGLAGDIIGHFFVPFFALIELIFAEISIGRFILIFISDIFIWYLLVCFYVTLKEKKMKRVKSKNIMLVLMVVLLSNIVYGISDSNSSNNVMSKNVDVVDTKKLELAFVPVDNPNDYARRNAI